MGKYKYDFIVSGSESLLGAMVKELKDLGYTQSTRGYSRENPILYIFGNNGCESEDTVYNFFDSAGLLKGIYSPEKVEYTLPQDWDEVLKLASTPYKVVPKYKVGDWLYWNDENKDTVFRIKSLNSYEVVIEWFDGGKQHETEYSVIPDFVRLATASEIDSYLRKILRSKFETGDHFIGVEELSKKDSCYDEMWKKSNAQFGSILTYDPKTDTMYSKGYGVYIVYKNGKFAEKTQKLPKLHNYDGKTDGTFITYGCKKIKKTDVALLNTYLLDVQTRTGYKIDVVVDGYTIKAKDIQEIVSSFLK